MGRHPCEAMRHEMIELLGRFLLFLLATSAPATATAAAAPALLLWRGSGIVRLLVLVLLFLAVKLLSVCRVRPACAGTAGASAAPALPVSLTEVVRLV